MNFKSPVLVTVLGLALLFPVALRAQSDIDTLSVPANTIGAFVFSLSKIKANPKLEDLPYEVMANQFESDLGLDIFTIKQGSIVVYPGKEPGSEPQYAVILKLTEKPALDGPQMRDLGDESGYKAKSLPFMPASLLVIDDTTLMILLDSSEAKNFVDAETGTLSEIVEKVTSKSWNAFAVLDAKGMMAAYGDMIRDGAKQIPLLPPAVAQLIPLLDELEAAEVVMQVEPYRLEARLRFSDAATAAKASGKIREAAELGAQMGVGLLAAQMDAENPTQAAGLEYFQRLIKQVPEMPNFQTKGKELTFTMKDDDFLLPLLAMVSLGNDANFSSLFRGRRISRSRSVAVPMARDAVRSAGGVAEAVETMEIEIVEEFEKDAGDAFDGMGLEAEQEPAAEITDEEAMQIKKRLEELGVEGLEGMPLEVQKAILQQKEQEQK